MKNNHENNEEMIFTKSKGFSIIPNELIEEWYQGEISANALALYAFLYKKLNIKSFKTSLRGLIVLLPISEHTIKNTINELKEHGYLIVEKTKKGFTYKLANAKNKEIADFYQWEKEQKELIKADLKQISQEKIDALDEENFNKLGELVENSAKKRADEAFIKSQKETKEEHEKRIAGLHWAQDDEE